MTLMEFLNARLNEAEKAAHDAGEARIAWLTYRDGEGQILYTTVASGSASASGIGDVWTADGRELSAPASVQVVHDPARVLRGLAAKRRLIERHHDIQGWCAGCGNDLTYRINECPELRDLASVFADHADYQDEWQPELTRPDY